MRKLIPAKFFTTRILENAQRYKNEKTKRAGCFLSFGNPCMVVSRAAFEKVIDAEFEGKLYKIPAGYDEWLTKVYGDYMTPPPESQRETRHPGILRVKE